MSRVHSFAPELLESRRLLSASYEVKNLVSDGAVPANFIDKNLVNSWGISVGPFGIRVADNGSSSTTRYNGHGQTNGALAHIPGGGGAADGAPTGIVFNTTNDFVIHHKGRSAPAKYIFVNEDGGIIAYNNAVNVNPVLVEDSSDEGSIYKGDAIASVNGKNFLYAADFHGKRVAVYDKNFHDADLKGDFKEPNLPSAYAPFNLAELNGHMYIAFAKTKIGSGDEADGAHLGIIDEFNNDGTFVKRIATGGALNAPWGMTLATQNFGVVKAGDLLVGNFGDGRINVFSGTTFKGQLKGSNGQPISIDGLWGIAFGNGKNGARTDRLYFAAGTNDEADGLLGSLQVVSSGASLAGATSVSSMFSDKNVGSDLSSVLG